ncbi:hypothetical protein DFR65_101115 [Oceanihabitans sediminis]|uniref:Uncharacterized protein n=1 Tax=Oceanihabitans sediminis TaxID=1812012 RepID=A0A368P9K6_9FLAO|nr:hypothetical protein [Oceanihabitans sediminis]RBP34232.1 hypothetical protein DFR65_101115 [Oceanihabitans sediminis]RCU57921.1 hypothetical protein DU428_00570 [Oceanihabitans sediminis]
MKKIKNCKHCYEPFQSRRSNHVYCTTSCKTKASYKRNNYKYISGHYQKEKKEVESQDKLMAPDLISKQLVELENKVEFLANQKKETKGALASDIKNVALGSVAADAAIYTAKKMFMPNSLPATKKDIELLKQEIQQLNYLLKLRRS